VNPSPDEYNIKRTILERKPYPHNGNSAVFQNPTLKPKEKSHIKEVMNLLQEKSQQEAKILGPGIQIHFKLRLIRLKFAKFFARLHAVQLDERF
jgi:hypothetical protein